MLDAIVEPDDDGLVPPPQEEITVLCDLARVGNMRAIAERADHVIAMDPRYAAFGTRLRKLAERLPVQGHRFAGGTLQRAAARILNLINYN